MTKITDSEIRVYIKNINHSSDVMKECMTRNNARNDAQHTNILEEMKDLKKEMILLRKDSNKIILVAFIILGGVLGVSKLLGGLL